MRKFRVVVEGKSYEVDVEEISVETENLAQPVQISAPVPATKSTPADGIQLKSPMPGAIINLTVAEGASVKKGDTVVILEAMKMENDISANANGIISFVVNKGATVNTGDILAVIS